LRFILYVWVEWIVMLSRMRAMNIIEWWVPLKKGVVTNVELYQNYSQRKWKWNLNDPM
jgi:hypothetical protein